MGYRRWFNLPTATTAIDSTTHIAAVGYSRGDQSLHRRRSLGAIDKPDGGTAFLAIDEVNPLTQPGTT
ncbi:hypothetical protein AU184_26705 [Mycolicibacterium novocastrense]|nr:hypothetical protein AU183_04495 [Mycolicibacterium novocastrense]KUH68687.1 hypothetical protein AU184_26705 [Mycolicibacterium novocastrense]KUH74372.1 hypothetical protein AU072_17260 [Mycolicibacterium novocastrense]